MFLVLLLLTKGMPATKKIAMLTSVMSQINKANIIFLAFFNDDARLKGAKTFVKMTNQNYT
jgi:hypothetical protein